ncbi:unnamed protein product, partial [Prunus brigantina]
SSSFSHPAFFSPLLLPRSPNPLSHICAASVKDEFLSFTPKPVRAELELLLEPSPLTRAHTPLTPPFGIR